MQNESSARLAPALCLGLFFGWLTGGCLDNDVAFNPADSGPDAVAAETDGGDESPSDTDSARAADTKGATGEDSGQPCTPSNGGEETCDGKDNDCDGKVDEELTRKCGSQDGVCKDAVVACTDGEFPECGAGEYGEDWEEEERSCDEKDNDCDGVVDRDGLCDFAVSIASGAFDGVSAVAVDDKRGDVFVAGSTQGSLVNHVPAGDHDVFVARYDSTGNQKWIEFLATDTQELANSIAISRKQGLLFVGGTTQGNLKNAVNQGDRDGFVAIYSLKGTFKELASISSPSRDVVVDLEVDGTSGTAYVTGFTGGAPSQVTDGSTTPGVFIGRLNPDGTWGWMNILKAGGNDRSGGVAVTDGGSSVLVAGVVTTQVGGLTPTGTSDIGIAECDIKGSCNWLTLLGGEGNESPYDIEVDGQTQRFFVSGATSGPIGDSTHGGDSDAFLAGFDRSGEQQWVELFGGSRQEFPTALALDPGTGDLFATGIAYGGFNDQKYNGGSADGFLVRYSSSGNQKWTKILGTDKRDLLIDVGGDLSGRVVVGGGSDGGIQSLPRSGKTDGFWISISD